MSTKFPMKAFFLVGFLLSLVVLVDVTLNPSVGSARQATSTKKNKILLSEKKVTDPEVKTLGRLDPHGARNLNLKSVSFSEHKECTVCHVPLANNDWVLRANFTQVCFSCHNSAPHSGIVEHERHNVSCITCHLPHRSGGKTGEKPSGFFEVKHNISSPEGYRDKSNPQAMLRNTCTDCHRWDKP